MFKLDQILMRISNAVAIYFVGELLNAASERVIKTHAYEQPRVSWRNEYCQFVKIGVL